MYVVVVAFTIDIQLLPQSTILLLRVIFCGFLRAMVCSKYFMNFLQLTSVKDQFLCADSSCAGKSMKKEIFSYASDSRITHQITLMINLSQSMRKLDSTRFN